MYTYVHICAYIHTYIYTYIHTAYEGRGLVSKLSARRGLNLSYHCIHIILECNNNIHINNVIITYILIIT